MNWTLRNELQQNFNRNTTILSFKTRARLGRVAPLRRPRSVYKSNLECSFFSCKEVESQGQWPQFSIPAEKIPRCIFGANLVILAQIYDELLHGQAKFPGILSQNGQMTLKVMVDDIYFQYQLRVSQDACLVQIWRF